MTQDEDGLVYYTAYTLVDITDSKNTDPRSPDKLGYNQAQNLNVLLQLIGLRAQPIVLGISKYEDQDLGNYKFNHTGKHTVWKLVFKTEYANAWAANGNLTHHLEQDCNGVAVSTGLTETADMKSKTFALNDNLYFTTSVKL